MLKFRQFLLEEDALKLRPPMSSKEGTRDNTRHLKKYFSPEKIADTTYRLFSKHGNMQKGDVIKVTHTKSIDGVTHAVTDKGEEIPIHRISRPGTFSNRGAEYERALADRLKQRGLMHSTSSTAGFSSGVDFHIKDKNGNVHPGEAKHSTDADFGQLTLSHTPEKGWHISDAARQRHPEYAKHIENAKVGDKSYLEHINSSFGPPGTNIGKVVRSDSTDLEPLHGFYGKKASILQVGTHGAYSIGDNKTFGFPRASGSGVFKTRQKKTNSLTVHFRVQHLNPSEHSLDKEDTLSKIENKPNA